jgi:protein SCO1
MLFTVSRTTLVQAVAAIAALAVIGGAVFVLWPSGTSPEPVRISRGPVFQGNGPFKGARVPPGKTAPDFTLHDQTGRPLRLSAQRGKLVLITFLYTRCQSVCPLTAIGLDSIVRGLGRRASDVEILAVSVDPTGDTQTAVREYIRARRLGPEFHWLIGKRTELFPVWRRYNVGVSGETTDVIAHTAPVLLLDRRGRPRVYYQQPLSRPKVAHDVHLLLGNAS